MIDRRPFPARTPCRATSLVALLVGALVVVGTATAHAQPRTGRDAEARSLFDAGVSAFDDGRYETALERFQEAYEISGRAALLYNIAQCYDRLRRDEDTIATFERYLEALPQAENRAQVEGRVRALREAIERERAEREAELRALAAANANPGADATPPAPTPTDVAAASPTASEPASAPAPLTARSTTDEAPSRRGRRIAILTSVAVVAVTAAIVIPLTLRDDPSTVYESGDVGPVFARF